MRDEVADGWKISQVESLVGLPRRDIQRACYEGAGGLGLVHPRNTSWGWRIYEASDIAVLFLIAQARRQTGSLEDACREVVKCQHEAGLCECLARSEWHAGARRDEESGAWLAARALCCALGQDGCGSFAEMLDTSFAESVCVQGSGHAVLRLAAEGLFPQFLAELAQIKRDWGSANCKQAAGACEKAAKALVRSLSLGTREACELLVRALNSAGVGLACELWLGPATHSFANTALEAFLVAACGQAASGMQNK